MHHVKIEFKLDFSTAQNISNASWTYRDSVNQGFLQGYQQFCW